MASIVELMQKQPDLCSMEGASEESIINAEVALGLSFAADYRQYIAAFGAASVVSHELTGICASKRLNVVDVTLMERAKTAIPSNWYVLEQPNIDGIVVWQSSDSEIFQVNPNGIVYKIANSLIEYLQFK